MSSKILRCSRENSDFNSEEGGAARPFSRAARFSDGLADGVGDGLDIAFTPAIEHKSTAAPLFRFTVDARPEGNEVISRGNQRQQNHEPDGKPGNPVDG